MLDLSPLTQAELNRRAGEALTTAGHYMVVTLDDHHGVALKLGQEAARDAQRLMSAAYARIPKES